MYHLTHADGSSSIFCTIIGCTVAQKVESATPGEEVLSLIPAVAARSLLVGSVSI